jgi:hypothetical protein
VRIVYRSSFRPSSGLDVREALCSIWSRFAMVLRAVDLGDGLRVLFGCCSVVWVLTLVGSREMLGAASSDRRRCQASMENRLHLRCPLGNLTPHLGVRPMSLLLAADCDILSPTFLGHFPSAFWEIHSALDQHFALDPISSQVCPDGSKLTGRHRHIACELMLTRFARDQMSPVTHAASRL